MKDLPKKSLQDLHPNGETDFWKFYLTNKDACDKIISCQIEASFFFGEPETKQDIQQAVLVTLHQCDILTQYDPARGAAFNTYFTNLVRSHIQRQLLKLRTHTYHPYTTFIPKGEDNNLRYKRIFFKALNGVPLKDLDRTPKDLETLEAEETMIRQDIIATLQKKLSGEALRVFKLMCLEYTKKEMGDILKATSLCIANQTKKINDLAFRITA